MSYYGDTRSATLTQHRRPLMISNPSYSPLTRWAAAALIALALLALFRIGWRLTPLLQTLHPKRLPITETDTQRAHAALGHFETVQFKTADGLSLRAWYKPSVNGAVVIMVHGGSANRAWFITEATELARRGIGVLMFDSRACGESEGKVQTWGDQETRDVDAAVTYVVARPDVNPNRIGIVGYSIGASSASMVAARDPRLRAVFLNAIWPTLQDELIYKSSFPKAMTSWLAFRAFDVAGVNWQAVRPIDALPQIAPRPLVILAGEFDADTPLPQAQRSFAAAAEPKAFWMVPGADHDGYLTIGGDAYLKRFGDFFSTALL
jgi:uncharacterized protein